MKITHLIRLQLILAFVLSVYAHWLCIDNNSYDIRTRNIPLFIAFLPFIAFIVVTMFSRTQALKEWLTGFVVVQVGFLNIAVFITTALTEVYTKDNLRLLLPIIWLFHVQAISVFILLFNDAKLIITCKPVPPTIKTIAHLVIQIVFSTLILLAIELLFGLTIHPLLFMLLLGVVLIATLITQAKPTNSLRLFTKSIFPLILLSYCYYFLLLQTKQWQLFDRLNLESTPNTPSLENVSLTGSFSQRNGKNALPLGVIFAQHPANSSPLEGQLYLRVRVLSDYSNGKFTPSQDFVAKQLPSRPTFTLVPSEFEFTLGNKRLGAQHDMSLVPNIYEFTTETGMSANSQRVTKLRPIFLVNNQYHEFNRLYIPFTDETPILSLSMVSDSKELLMPTQFENLYLRSGTNPPKLFYQSNQNTLVHSSVNKVLSYAFVNYSNEPLLPTVANLEPQLYAVPYNTSELTQLDEFIAQSGFSVGKSYSVADLSNLEKWLEQRFQYSDNFKLPRAWGRDPLLHWLKVGKVGHCQYFASAFTLLARRLGFQSRVIIGYTTTLLPYEPNTYLTQGANTDESAANMFVGFIYGKNAHAWSEVYCTEKQAWIRFDPTPAAIASETSQEGNSAYRTSPKLIWLAVMLSIFLLTLSLSVKFVRTYYLGCWNRTLAQAFLSLLPNKFPKYQELLTYRYGPRERFKCTNWLRLARYTCQYLISSVGVRK